MVKASFIRRFAAMVTDGLIVSALSALVGFIIGIVGGLATARTNADPSAYTLISFLFGLVVGWFYMIEVPLHTNGQTLGKKIFHIRIVKETGELTRMTLFAREYIGKFLSGIFFCIGYLVALGESKKALHDRIVDTIVVKVPEKAYVYVDDKVRM